RMSLRCQAAHWRDKRTSLQTERVPMRCQASPCRALTTIGAAASTRAGFEGRTANVIEYLPRPQCPLSIHPDLPCDALVCLRSYAPAGHTACASLLAIVPSVASTPHRPGAESR